jgi:ABC-type transport system involved in multi-copper enzyme maturation permease subunit
MIVLSIPLTIGVLLSLVIIMNLSSGLVLTGVEFARIFLLIALFMIYLSFIVLLSLLISSLSRQSVTSLLILLFLLILMVVIIPNTAGIIVDESVKTMSEYEMVQRQDAVFNDNLKRLIEVEKQAKKGLLDTEEEIFRAYNTAFSQRYDNQRQIEREYLQSIVKKRRWAQNIAKISPSAVFQYASESLANSGSLREEHFYKAAEKYWKVYEAYVKEKVGEIIWYTWPGVTITRDDGKKIEVPGVSPKEYHGDISDFPEFVVPEIPIKESIKYSGWNITILILWNIALFLLAHVAFLKYDIR